MPGKYSYGVVLSQYSSQGLVPLPNGQQLLYSKQEQNARAQSALASRPRKPLSSTNLRDNTSRSRASRSVTSLSPRETDSSIDASWSRTLPSRTRVVIVDSDSEESDDHVRPHQRPASSSMSRDRPQPRKPMVRRPGSSRTADCRVSVTAQTAGGASASIPSPVIPAHRISNYSQSQSPGPPRQGVKALIQARHKAESAAPGTLAEARLGGQTSDLNDSITINDFIKSTRAHSRPHSRLQPRTEGVRDDAQIDGMSLLEFIATKPDRTSNTETAVGNIPPSIRSPHKRRDEGFVPQRHSVSRHNGHSFAITSTSPGFEYTNHQQEPNFDESNDTTTTSVLERPSISKPYTHLTSSTSQLSGHGVRDEAGMFTKRIVPRSPTPPVTVVKISPGSPYRTAPNTMSGKAAASNGAASHTYTTSNADSVDSYLSQNSSIFGLSSAGDMTLGSSRLSSGPRPDSRRGTPQSWGLPPIGKAENVSQSFADGFFDINDRSTMFMSEDEEVEEDDLPTPRLQTLDGGDMLAPTRQFGMISAGRDFTARERKSDEISELSAVFPPDISKYKYGDDEIGPLSAAMNGTSKKETTRKLRKEDGMGLGILGRLKLKRSGRQMP